MKKKISILLMICLMLLSTSTIAMATTEVNNIKAAVLSEAAKGEIAIANPTVNDGIVTVPILAEGIVEHLNEEDEPGYWVGFALIRPDEATSLEYAFADTQDGLSTLTAHDLEENVDGQGSKGFAFYTDAYLREKVWAKVQWKKDTENLGDPITYKMDLSGVKINIANLNPAILSEDIECALELDEAIIENNTITVPVIGEDLVEHKNAEGNYGYWSGFAVTAPSEATKVKYTFGDDVDKIIDLEENVDGEGSKGIAVYTDVYKASSNKVAKIQWVYGAKEGHPITYKMDFSKVELKFAEVSKAILKSDDYVETYEIDSEIVNKKVNVKITATELVEHLNKEDKPGYWIGFALTAPQGATQVKYTFGETAVIDLEENIDEEGSKGIAFYTDAYVAAPKTTAKVQWKYGNELGNEVTYKMDLTNVKFNHGEIVAAVLAENAGCDDLAIDNVTVEQNGEVTVKIKGSGLVEHKNAENTLGYWAGFALIAPEYATKVEYTFGGVKKEIELEENIDGKGSKGIAFYTDVCAENPATTAEVRWVYESQYGHSVKYNMDFDGVDISISNVIAAKLAENVDCQLELGKLSIDNDIVTVPLKAQNLPEHKNAQGEYGYWVGFGLVAPEEATKVKYTFGDETKTIDLEENVDGEGAKGIAFYTDAYLETPKTEAMVQWMKDENTVLGEPVVYKMDLAGVKLKMIDVLPAILTEDVECRVAIETPTLANGIVTVPVKVTDLMEHKNANNTSGYWVGMALVAPQGATKVKYAFANTETALEILTEKDLETEITINHDKGIAFYADARETSPKIWVKVQWVYGDKVGHIVKYKMDLTGVTLKKYKITFDANGHGTAPQAQEVVLNQLAIQPTNPTATGYSFGGWYKEVNCLTKYNFAMPVTADITLYAKWTTASSSSGGGGGGGGGSSDEEVKTYKITVTEGKNGSISPNGTVTVEKGDNQKFKIKPDKGYEIEDVIVDGESVGVVDSYTFKNVKKKHTIKATFQKIKEDVEEEEKEETKPVVQPEVKPTQNDKKYNDVNDEAWYATPIQYVTRNNLMSGVGNDKFSPSDNGTRAMIVTILYNKEGKPAVYGKTNFSDVKTGAWYESPITWAKTNNIVDGYGNGTFGPDTPVTREQMAVILYNYAKSKETVTMGSSALNFSDVSNINTWAYDAMKWCVSNKIINGKANNKLDPKGLATRAEIATMIMNFCEM